MAMPNYEVEVAVYHIVTVEAASEVEAEEKAMALAEGGQGGPITYIETTYIEGGNIGKAGEAA